MLFVKKAVKLFENFETLFQTQEPLLHILHEEMVLLTKQILGRFMRKESFSEWSGAEGSGHPCICNVAAEARARARH
ncbi:hypothetical protein HPB48_000895 [Haemaphysalis longicornis]|uniref:Uncharacterized protein n=1 Tax=Haemaphysalis longicornis TaxID=44386 RepID=A0A9J6FPE7_HAELO|nr:hypothetical protein HPB48_000895 [Haemaphysalis longicornis]